MHSNREFAHTNTEKERHRPMRKSAQNAVENEVHTNDWLIDFHFWVSLKPLQIMFMVSYQVEANQSTSSYFKVNQSFLKL